MNVEEALLTTLRRTRRKTPKEIFEEMKPKLSIALHGTTLIKSLFRFERKGLVASRYRKIPRERSRTPKFIYKKEYVLTKAGLANQRALARSKS